MLMKMELGCPVICMILLGYILCCSLIMSRCHGIVEAAETLKSFEDFEIEQKLKIINKPAVKIIESIYGERYGCVDFYKQPALDHPSMKNHTFHYKMHLTTYPEGSKMQKETSRNKTFGYLWKNGIGCPIGTVPVLRITKNDLLRMKSLAALNTYPRSSWNDTYKPMSSNVGSYVAVVRTQKKKPRIYNGASMNIAISTPSVKPLQSSSARMHFQIGIEYIQVGWTVNPDLYHDSKSRLFVFTNAGGHSCYHNFCPSGSGMIQVRQDIPIGLSLERQKDFDMAILKDQMNGNWWLVLDTSQVEIGFWPSSRFKESSGTGVEWGGEVYSSTISSPPMGSGHFPTGTPVKDSYIRFITIVDGNYKTDKTVKNTERHSDDTSCYKVTDATESFWKSGHISLYGGPGCNKL